MALKITKGIFEIHAHFKTTVVEAKSQRPVANTDMIKEQSENEANASLIAEAFNVANETGLSPRELREQRNSLMDALLKILSAKSDSFDAIKNMGIPEIKEAVVLLAKITESQDQTTITNPEP